MRGIPLMLLIVGLLPVSAQETAEDWIVVLSKAYQDQGGFTAEYKSERKGKTLGVSIAADFHTGQANLRMVMAQPGNKTESRQWSTPEGEIFSDLGGKRQFFGGLKEELSLLESMIPPTKEGKLKPDPLILQFSPGILLTSDSLATAFGFTIPPKPSWAGNLEKAQVKDVTDDTVTLSTQEFGDLTFNRSTGVIQRQSVKGAGDEDRVLELVKYSKNPGEDAVTLLTKGWEVAGAEDAGDIFLEALRFQFFQLLISGVEENKMELNELTEFLHSSDAQLRKIGASAAHAHPESSVMKMDWKKTLDGLRGIARMEWQNKHPGGVLDENVLDAALKTPGFRARVAKMVATANERTGARNTGEILGLILGEDVQFRAETEEGKAAKKVVETKLVAGYLDAITTEKMTEFWGSVSTEK